MLVTKSNPVGGAGRRETPGESQQEKGTQSRERETERKARRQEGKDRKKVSKTKKPDTEGREHGEREEKERSRELEWFWTREGSLPK